MTSVLKQIEAHMETIKSIECKSLFPNFFTFRAQKYMRKLCQTAQHKNGKTIAPFDGE